MTDKTILKRSLGLWAIVGLGLGYMTPTVVFDTFGIVSGDTNGVVPLAYLAAMVAMLFTALSYGKMVRVFPSAGSAYTYTKETINPHLGFMVGWAALLDYILLPMVNALIIRIYMQSLFPSVPAWIWVVCYVIIVTGIIVWSMNSTSNVNMFLLVFSIALILAFIVLAFIQLFHGMGQGTIFTTVPLFHSNVHVSSVLMGATVVCFSFIGFDAVTMYTEEAKDPKAVPKAIMLTVLIGGGIFFIAAYFTQSLFPNISHFKNTDDTLPEIGLYVGGKIFQLLFIAGGFACTLASGLSSHASVSRLLYVMGRNGVFPKKLFGYVHPKFRTPVFDIVLVGAISLFAIAPSLDLISSVINFGALIAFTFVNFSVIAYFVFRKKRYKTGRDVFSYIILPLIGAGCTGVLWYFLHGDALKGGIVWVIIGFIYMLFKTKFFRAKLADFGFDEAEKPTELNG
ncbi:APC family permease [Scopulibacillus cellulosilyticus]|uniref:APC family permease n=1 Tax=Scopulibacillus cellulosilyticus TaxID=2665665 RepID=A0ABW2PSL4_9BACL